MSDNHGKLDFSVPSCDLLLIGGDVCPDWAPGTSWGSSMQEQWLNSKWLNWLDAQPADRVIATFGNHDFVRKQEAPANFKVDELVEISTGERIPCGCPPSTDNCRCKLNTNGLKIWFSPWSNTFGGWAWMADPDTLGAAYSLIPNDIDIIVSHQPPYGYGDQVPERYRFSPSDIENDGHVGSRELLATIERVKPKVLICGHIHSGFGLYYHVRLDGGKTKIYNVSIVDEAYHRVNNPTEIVLD